MTRDERSAPVNIDSSTLVPWWEREGYIAGKFDAPRERCARCGLQVPKVVTVNTSKGMKYKRVCPVCGEEI